jgi:LuxR family maltose regulon positive regulatory protein
MQAKQECAAAFIQQDAPPAENMVWWIEIPAVTFCRALLAEGTDHSLLEAEKGLQSLLQLNQANHNILHSISILSLLAVVHLKRGRMNEALAAAEKALTLTDSTDIVQPFLELGAPMANLLQHLQKKQVAAGYVGKILAAFGDKPASTSTSTPPGETPSPSTPPAVPELRPQPLVEPLTNREMDVLELLDERLQNKEIAEKLFVTTETIKGHLKNIYQKLGVSNRRQAVAEAKRLEII